MTIEILPQKIDGRKVKIVRDEKNITNLKNTFLRIVTNDNIEQYIRDFVNQK